MASFSLDFLEHDINIFDILGDDITVTSPDLTVTVIKGEFKQVYDADELLRRGDLIYPTIEIMEQDKDLFVSGCLVMFADVTYGYLRKQPLEERTYEIVLRNIRKPL